MRDVCHMSANFMGRGVRQACWITVVRDLSNHVWHHLCHRAGVIIKLVWTLGGGGSRQHKRGLWGCKSDTSLPESNKQRKGCSLHRAAPAEGDITHLEHFPEGSISQLTDYVPYFLGILISADVFVLLLLLLGSQFKYFTEIKKGHPESWLIQLESWQRDSAKSAKSSEGFPEQLTSAEVCRVTCVSH